MVFTKTLAGAAVIYATVFTSTVDAWKGVVMLYEKTHFAGKGFPWFVDSAQKCFDLGCLDDNKITSAKWKELPQKRQLQRQSAHRFLQGRRLQRAPHGVDDGGEELPC
ncbi:hypothetical protein PHYPSEUDO_004790 [Phytophthora pseudosyringae]|uniref:Uncharacterized protein n=1 Tax=Phytophthora pseudosyringae TaxID=221518 RepID=A0A8T1VR58_9STRA|nr:hypothetical protein PHYPSEUDO_004790 [Phytophthora pseudosyringae]